MARIVGVDLPKDKRIEIGLTYIYGIGKSLSSKILKQVEIDKDIRVKDLTDQQVVALRNFISENIKNEGNLRRDVAMNIKRLQEIGCNRGIRHRNKMPVRGQNTRNNARTAKGLARKKK